MLRKLPGVLSVIAALAFGSGCGEEAGPAPAPAADAARFETIDGENFSLPDQEGTDAVILAWTGVGCPMSKVYLPRLKALAREFSGRPVRFFLINSNAQDSPAEIRAVAETHDLGFPVVRDRGGALAGRFGATRTTEVVVLDRSRAIAYRGAVDDQYGYRRDESPGAAPNSVLTYRKDAPSNHFLRDALEDILSGRPVSTASTDPMGCALGLTWGEGRPEHELTFHEQIEPIIQKNCQGCHHRAGSAPFALTEYEKVRGWSNMIKEVVRERRMPPWNADPEIGTFKNRRSLSEQEIDRIVRWVDRGSPRGDPSRGPPKRVWPETWAIGEPDVVLTVPKHHVPAEGRIPYRYVDIETGFKEDRWIQAAQVRSTGNQVVHHVLIFLKEDGRSRRRKDRPWSPRWSWMGLFRHLPPAQRRVHIRRNQEYFKDLKNAGGGLFGYFLAVLPGELPTVFPEGQAQFLPAGATMTFQIHYQPLGTPVTSTTSLALRFSKERPREVREVWAATSVTFVIPPGAGAHPETARHRFQRGGRLLSLKPHMHVRGKTARYVLERLDGSRETLLHVPRYDFDWQHTYVFAEPKRVEKGETLHFLVEFDNSDGNPYNPDSSATVYFGLQTDEEMMIGYFEAIWDADEADSK